MQCSANVSIMMQSILKLTAFFNRINQFLPYIYNLNFNGMICHAFAIRPTSPDFCFCVCPTHFVRTVCRVKVIELVHPGSVVLSKRDVLDYALATCCRSCIPTLEMQQWNCFGGIPWLCCQACQRQVSRAATEDVSWSSLTTFNTCKQEQVAMVYLGATFPPIPTSKHCRRCIDLSIDSNGLLLYYWHHWKCYHREEHSVFNFHILNASLMIFDAFLEAPGHTVDASES